MELFTKMNARIGYLAQMRDLEAEAAIDYFGGDTEFFEFDENTFDNIRNMLCDEIDKGNDTSFGEENLHRAEAFQMAIDIMNGMYDDAPDFKERDE